MAVIVDDEPMILAALSRALASEYDIGAVASGREALDRIRAVDRFDVLLCDLMMPQMTGMDLHGEISRSAPDVARRMVFMTGGAFTSAAREFLDRVPNPCLEKPFDLDNLRVAVARLLR